MQSDEESSTLVNNEKHLQAEVQRLRAHLLTSEESFTQEILELDQKVQQLEHALQLSELAKTVTSTEQVEQAKAAAARQLEEQIAGLEVVLGNKTSELANAQTAVANLQEVLDQLQAEHQHQLNQATESAASAVAKIREELKLVQQREQPLRVPVNKLQFIDNYIIGNNSDAGA